MFALGVFREPFQQLKLLGHVLWSMFSMPKGDMYSDHLPNTDESETEQK